MLLERQSEAMQSEPNIRGRTARCICGHNCWQEYTVNWVGCACTRDTCGDGRRACGCVRVNPAEVMVRIGGIYRWMPIQRRRMT